MAELKDILGENDFTAHLETTSNLGTSLTRVEIEGVLADKGVSLPLDRDVSFFISDDNNHYFSVGYLIAVDKYTWLKLKSV